MSLQNFQLLLLKMYTDGALLSEFLKDPSRVLDRYELTERERHALTKLPRLELEEFHEQLVGKRKRIGRKILKRPDAIVLVAFSEEGPAIMWGAPEHPHKVYISPGMYWLTREMGLGQKTASWGALLGSHRASHRSSLSDLFLLGKLLSARGLFGKTVVNI